MNTGRLGRNAAILLATTMLGAGGVGTLSVERAQAQAATQQVYSFDIPAKPIRQAMNDIGRITGLAIVFDETTAASLSGRSVRGSMTASNALSTLLSGTDLQYRFTNSNTVTIASALTATTDRIGSSSGETVLATIAIYGSRNATALNDTSASVGILTAEQIADSQLRSFRDGFRRMANVMDGDWTDAGFVIRGVNSEGLVPGGAPLATLYVDGVQQTVRGARRGARGLFDVEQLEVYRGPQSTLSGRAAMAGAIYVKTKDPVFEREGEISGTIGTNNLYGTAFMVNTPLVEDVLSLRINGEFQRSKNDINYPTFESYDRYNDFTHDAYYQIRGKVLFEPAEMP